MLHRAHSAGAARERLLRPVEGQARRAAWSRAGALGRQVGLRAASCSPPSASPFARRPCNVRRRASVASMVSAAENLAASILALEVLLLTATVVLRYGFNRPLTWSDEIAEMLIIWQAMLGAAVALYRGEHLGLGAIVSACRCRCANGCVGLHGPRAGLQRGPRLPRRAPCLGRVAHADAGAVDLRLLAVLRDCGRAGADGGRGCGAAAPRCARPDSSAAASAGGGGRRRAGAVPRPRRLRLAGQHKPRRLLRRHRRDLPGDGAAHRVLLRRGDHGLRAVHDRGAHWASWSRGWRRA